METLLFDSNEGRGGWLSSLWHGFYRRFFSLRKVRRDNARKGKFYTREGKLVTTERDEIADVIEKVSTPECPDREKGKEIYSLEELLVAPAVDISKECPVCIFECRCSPTVFCRKLEENKGKAIGVLRHLKRFYGIKAPNGLPPQIDCLSFRSSVRQSLSDLTEIEELTVKTTSKIIRRPCTNCEAALEPLKREYKKKRFQPVEVVPDDLKRFKETLSRNVPQGWNNRDAAYIPNGHATASHSRSEGGTWVEEEFSDVAEIDVAFSSGKPRIVTKYSSYNSEILFPLHQALYAVLRRKGWLLVGSPTNEKVQGLNGSGALMSYDYESATDNIKAEYCRAAIQVLQEKSEGLTDEQRRCLQVVGELRFPGTPVATRGQPMGSLMSFPLLCLINKTVVDLALTDLFVKKEISFKEWTSHRCLINGDDLLLRSPIPDSGEYDRIHRRWGDSVGLVVNSQKTMVSEEKGEINSTLFVRGEEHKKGNMAALYMSNETDDVVRVAMEAATSLKEFRKMVRLNAHILSLQSVKLPSPVPMRYRLTLLGDAKIRRALRAAPVFARPAATSLVPVVDRPSGYDLSREEERKAIAARVARVREGRLWETLPKTPRRRGGVVHGQNRISDVFRTRLTPESDKVLKPCSDFWEKKRKSEMRVEGEAADQLQILSDIESGRVGSSIGLSCVSPRGPGLAGRLIGLIRHEKENWRVKRNPSSTSVGGSPETWALSGHTDVVW